MTFNLRGKLASGEIVVAPGAYDMISALMAQRAGFDFVYASGFWLTGSYLGLPDVGIATYTQMLDRVVTDRQRPFVAQGAGAFWHGLQINLSFLVVTAPMTN